MSFHIVKIAIVGDGAVGKTSLLTKYCNGEYCGDYIPTTMDMYEKLVHDGKGHNIKFQFFDMAGQEDYKRLREHYYDDTIDMVILAYAINNQSSFLNAQSKWIPEIKSNLSIRDKPLIVIGTKLDWQD